MSAKEVSQVSTIRISNHAMFMFYTSVMARLKDQSNQKNMAQLLKFCLTRCPKITVTSSNLKSHIKVSFTAVGQVRGLDLLISNPRHLVEVVHGVDRMSKRSSKEPRTYGIRARRSRGHANIVILWMSLARVVPLCRGCHLRPLPVLLALPAAVFSQRTTNPGPNVPCVPKTCQTQFFVGSSLKVAATSSAV